MKYVTILIICFVYSGVAMACPDEDLWGEKQYTLSGDELYSAKRFRVVAGGNYELRSECQWIFRQLGSDRGQGYFTRRPDFTFDVPGLSNYELEISVDSECDSTLLINTSTVSWFYDDDDGANGDAMIRLTRPKSGIIDVWVGTYRPSDGNCDAVLKLETF